MVVLVNAFINVFLGGAGVHFFCGGGGNFFQVFYWLSEEDLRKKLHHMARTNTYTTFKQLGFVQLFSEKP